MVYRFSPPLDKFNLPMPEQNHYDVIRALYSVISDIVRVPTPKTKLFLHPHQQKLQFVVKNRRKSAEEA